ncbi:multiphosphoryl transfer protein 2 [includes phosphoenolpyruvate-protein phosphotransferase);phosphocarrier protein Hpr; fructose-like specific PTS system EIIA component] [Escherichia coli]|uniref:Multiphosphoryl transfer protein 2 [includes phosphoenolpyruvate-protein phosphotransferasephosphocarrier protein Hpr fructose-like specific PTS system EIIA component] n=1 Tax=Escherichia coli TaxID=562 RepID=A0A377DCQ6_ECOLX|nr:multiphosphoryl transfer protein 2 [includes phosphoenolpyruvate-protein phosphotransferase);phosphocarrier protein Hpr; fructose-like specific PTS system EIIA component] [Escherichia coli]
MALIVEFICELPNGVHARPASHVERCVILFHHN